MAKISNSFIKGRMNKDLDDRLIPQGEYRNAVNTQVSKSEGQNVGALENSIGNTLVSNADFKTITGVADIKSIGLFADEINNRVFVFLTNNTSTTYDPLAENFIVVYDAGTDTGLIIVKGRWLNFNIANPITGVNLLENLLFFTDNRNQPRVINVETAINDVLFYNNESKISVAKYYPYQAIELYRNSSNLTPTLPDNFYETTMYDVTSLSYPDGGSGKVLGSFGAATNILLLDKGTIQGTIKSGMNVAIIDSNGFLEDQGVTVNVVDYNFSGSQVEVELSGNVSAAGNDVVFAFQFNPYFDEKYNGDKDFLTKKFARFSYRFKFVDNEYSIFAPFTQECFIPKQDGYFMYDVENPDGEDTGVAAIPIELTSEQDTYRTTTVEFMENKVDKILLRIPLPVIADHLTKAFGISEIDILYKESNSTAVNVIDTITVEEIQNQSGVTAEVDPGAAGSSSFQLININGNPKIGSLVSDDFGQITDFPTLVKITSAGIITLSSDQTLAAGTILTFGNKNIYEYEYQAKKPYKVLPESDLLRTYDKIPVKALSQEVVSNRIVYGNYQDKHTPPTGLNYNLGVDEKASFSLGNGSADVDVAGYPIGATTIPIVAATIQGVINTGSIVSGPGIAANTSVTSFDPLGSIDIDTATTGPGLVGSTLTFKSPGSIQNTTSIIEYPNHTLKQNRNYQVGVVLSDIYGRQSTVVLSNQKGSTKFNNKLFKGSTIYTDYLEESVDQLTWPGNALKILFNETISPQSPNPSTLWPGLYNGDTTSSDYNPLGWYSYKIVVKQTEQEYYNVYLPGVMASYPDAIIEDAPIAGTAVSFDYKELNKTSHTPLYNDNINKVPRDLTEVGPEQRQFRSSVVLNGRVQNLNSVDPANNNSQFYPGAFPNIVSTIATDNDLFDGSKDEFFEPNQEFYNIESDPLIARINTPSGIFGQPPAVLAARSLGAQPGGDTLKIQNSTITLVALNGQPCSSFPQNCLKVGQRVEGPGIKPNTFITKLTPNGGPPPGYELELSIDMTPAGAGEVYQFSPIINTVPSGTLPPLGIYYYASPQLAVMETDPVESNLDIYWETTSSGLISELNEAIINDTASSVDFDSFNTSAFTEALSVNSNILSADFELVDQFGNSIGYITQTPPQLQLISVTDLTGTNIPIGPTGVFELIEPTPGSGFYNIRFNGIGSAPAGSLYFRSNTDLITYTFEFLATVNGVATTIVQSPVVLQNETPYNPGSRPCPGTVNWQAGDNTNPIPNTVVGALNGSSGILTGEAKLELTVSHEVTKQSDSSDVTSSFVVNTDASGNEVLATLSFAGGGTATVADGDYDVTITFTDPGPLEYQCTYVLSIDNSICRKYTFNIPATGGQVSFTGCGGSGPQINQYFAGDPGVPGPAFVCSQTIPTSAQIGPFTDSGGCTFP